MDAQNTVERQNVTVEEKQSDLQRDLKELTLRSAMGAMSVLPRDARFETKDDEEQVILVLRRHFATNLPWMIGSLMAVVLPFWIMAVGLFPEGLMSRYRLLLVALWILLVVGYAMEQFLIWFFNVYILTNERVVDIDFHNLLYREISDADLDKIQDVTIKGSGIGAAIFHYGDIFVQTAAEKQMFEFKAVPHPELVSRVIRELIEFDELYDERRGVE